MEWQIEVELQNAPPGVDSDEFQRHKSTRIGSLQCLFSFKSVSPW